MERKEHFLCIRKSALLAGLLIWAVNQVSQLMWMRTGLYCKNLWCQFSRKQAFFPALLMQLTAIWAT